MPATKEVKHRFPAGHSPVQHGRENCSCKPERRVTHHGTRRVHATITYVHHEFPESEED